MVNIKSLFRNLNLLNIFLLFGAILFAQYIVLPVLSIQFNFTLPSGSKTTGDPFKKPAANYPVPSISEYMLIADNNLFHPERKVPVEKKAGEEQQSLPKPEFVLYGTIITDDMHLAYLEDLKSPRSSPGRGKRQTAMKIGDSLSGFILKEIEADKITLVRGDEKMLVSVHDSQRKNMRGTPDAVSPKTPHQTVSKTQTAPLPERKNLPSTLQSKQTKIPGNYLPPRSSNEQRIIDFFERKQ